MKSKTTGPRAQPLHRSQEEKTVCHQLETNVPEGTGFFLSSLPSHAPVGKMRAEPKAPQALPPRMRNFCNTGGSVSGLLTGLGGHTWEGSFTSARAISPQPPAPLRAHCASTPGHCLLSCKVVLRASTIT